MTRRKNDILQGTLALLVLKTLADGKPWIRLAQNLIFVIGGVGDCFSAG